MDIPINSEHRLRSENLSWDLDVWYPRLKQFTFKTVFISLTIKERDAILRFNDVSWKNVNPLNKLTNYEVQTLLELEKEIHLRIKENFSENVAFIRLCGRSPKDGEPLHPDQFTQNLKKNTKNFLIQALNQTFIRKCVQFQEHL